MEPRCWAPTPTAEREPPATRGCHASTDGLVALGTGSGRNAQATLVPVSPETLELPGKMVAFGRKPAGGPESSGRRNAEQGALQGVAWAGMPRSPRPAYPSCARRLPRGSYDHGHRLSSAPPARPCLKRQERPWSAEGRGPSSDSRGDVTGAMAEDAQPAQGHAWGKSVVTLSLELTKGRLGASCASARPGPGTTPPRGPRAPGTLGYGFRPPQPVDAPGSSWEQAGALSRAQRLRHAFLGKPSGSGCAP